MGEVLHSTWVKLTELESGNTFIASLWTKPVNFQEQEDDLHCLPHSLFSFFSLGKDFRKYLKKLDIPSLAENSPFPCWSTNHSHLTSKLDEQECLFLSSFTLVLSSQCTSSALTHFTYLILLVHNVDTEGMRKCLTAFEYFVSAKPSTLSSFLGVGAI